MMEKVGGGASNPCINRGRVPASRSEGKHDRTLKWLQGLALPDTYYLPRYVGSTHSFRTTSYYQLSVGTMYMYIQQSNATTNKEMSTHI